MPDETAVPAGEIYVLNDEGVQTREIFTEENIQEFVESQDGPIGLLLRIDTIRSLGDAPVFIAGRAGVSIGCAVQDGTLRVLHNDQAFLVYGPNGWRSFERLGAAHLSQ